jgi:hypothetical protein
MVLGLLMVGKIGCIQKAIIDCKINLLCTINYLAFYPFLFKSNLAIMRDYSTLHLLLRDVDLPIDHTQKVNQKADLNKL